MILGYGFVFWVDKELGKEKFKVEKVFCIGCNVCYKKEWKYFEVGMEICCNGVIYLCINIFIF